MGATDDSYAAVELEVAVAALGEWSDAALVPMFTQALEAYCARCAQIPARERARRPRVLLDIDVWADPQSAAAGFPLVGMSIQRAAAVLSQRVRSGQTDPYAVLGTLARERAP